MISKTREGSKCYSREAALLEVSQDNFPLGQVGDKVKIGSLGVDQLKKYSQFPNIQSALDDIVNLYQVPIGGVVILKDITATPSGIKMQEELTFDGSATGGEIECYGLRIKVNAGDNKTTVRTKVFNFLNTNFTNETVAFDEVKEEGDSKLRVTFIDTNPHDNYSYSNNGITITGSTLTPAKPGYGSWSKIGESTMENPTTAGEDKLYYWMRTA